jgi:hypothetical protein
MVDSSQTDRIIVSGELRSSIVRPQCVVTTGPMFQWVVTVVTPVTHQVLGRSSKYNCFSEIIRKIIANEPTPPHCFPCFLIYLHRLTHTCLILLDADILTPARPEAIGSPWCLMLAVAPNFLFWMSNQPSWRWYIHSSLYYPTFFTNHFTKS